MANYISENLRRSLDRSVPDTDLEMGGGGGGGRPFGAQFGLKIRGGPGPPQAPPLDPPLQVKLSLQP